MKIEIFYHIPLCCRSCNTTKMLLFKTVHCKNGIMTKVNRPLFQEKGYYCPCCKKLLSFQEGFSMKKKYYFEKKMS